MTRKLALTIFFLLIFSLPLRSGEIARNEDVDSTRVNLTVQGIPLRQALKQLVSQTNLQIVFNDALIENVEASCACENSTLGQALVELLTPANLTFEALEDGQIVILRRVPLEKVDLHGFVTDAENGETLPYANISLAGTPYGTASNVNGYFFLMNVPAGSCTLEVTYVGYTPLTLPVDASPESNSLRIPMQQQAMQLEGVTVLGKNVQNVEFADRPGEIRLSPLHVSKLPAVGEVDILRSLQLVPGISAVNERSSGLYVRGGTPNSNLVLFDGITVYHADHFFGFISAFNTDAVKDVRVFKGGFPAKYGGRTASVVELTGRSGSFENFQMDTRLNLLSASSLVQTPIADRGSWLVSFRRSYTDMLNSGLYDRIYDSLTNQNGAQTPPSPNNPQNGTRRQLETLLPDFYYYDLNSKLTYASSSSDLLSVSFFNSGDNLDESQQFQRRSGQRENATSEIFIDDVNKWGNLGVSAKWSRMWSKSVFSNYLAAYSVYSSESQSGFNTTSSSPGPNQEVFSSSEDNEVRDLTLSLENEWQVTKTRKLEFGARYTRTNVDLRFVADDTVKILVQDNQAKQTAFYLQDVWRPSNALELNYGLRATHYGPTADLYLEPRLSFRVALNQDFSVKGAWGEYYQFVNRITNENVLQGNRDFWLLADRRLKPSFSEHRIFGLTYENRALLIDVEAYHKDLDGVADFSRPFRGAPDTPPAALFRLGAGEAKGLEFLLQKKQGRFTGWASYTLGEVTYRIPSINLGQPFLADHDRTHELKAVANYSFGPWHLSTTWIFASGAPYTRPESQRSQAKNSERLPTYHRMDLSISRQFSSRKFDWNFGISVFNLYNRTNVASREFVRETEPTIVRDVTTLKLTPTITLGFSFR